MCAHPTNATSKKITLLLCIDGVWLSCGGAFIAYKFILCFSHGVCRACPGLLTLPHTSTTSIHVFASYTVGQEVAAPATTRESNAASTTSYNILGAKTLQMKRWKRMR